MLFLAQVTNVVKEKLDILQVQYASSKPRLYQIRFPCFNRADLGSSRCKLERVHAFEASQVQHAQIVESTLADV
jgi:hypothetical protein